MPAMILQPANEREPRAPDGRFLVRYWGVRGSIPTPGAGTVRYGGNTTCVEVVCDDERIIIDAGTGIRLLGAALRESAPRGGVKATLLFSHFHSDHVIGLPFFAPLYDPRTRLTIGASTDNADGGLKGLRRVLSHPLFPVEYESLPADIAVTSVTAGEPMAVGAATVRTCRLRHPGGALGFRIEHRGRSFVHVSDLEHEGDRSDAELVALCRGADWISYDAMFVEGDEYDAHSGWGHSTWQAAMRLLHVAGAKRVIATHHAPEHDDVFMDDVFRALAAARPGCIVAAEGLEIDVLAGEALYPAGVGVVATGPTNVPRGDESG